METKDYAKEYGLRCKQIRQARGISQQALADMMHVTPQAISKWEKNGLSDVNTVMQLSNVLGQDITADQIDQEGSIGEIGKEILKLLVNNEGYLDYVDLSGALYGLSDERVGSEIFKLERIGMLVREQYTDFLDAQRDGVIITAKGLIAYKNSREFPADVSRVVTLEMRLKKGEHSIQDIIDNDKVSKILWKTDYYFHYRLNYLRYLKTHFRADFPQYIDDTFIEETESLISGESCFADLLFRMAKGITDGDYYCSIMDSAVDENPMEDSALDTLLYKAMGMDRNSVQAQIYLSKVIPGLDDFETILRVDGPVFVDESSEEAKEAAEEWAREIDMEDEDYYSPGKLLERLTPQERNNCAKWFSYEEVSNFVDACFEKDGPANPLDIDEHAHERAIDEAIKNIWELNPSTLDYFYTFPQEWEENGLAQKVRDIFGVPMRKMGQESSDIQNMED